VVLPRSDAARPATIYDVAREAGVSHQTVSRLLKGAAVRPATRERVEAAIDSLGYRLNATARALATSRSYRIGALVYELQELGPSRVAQGAANEARDSGYLLDIVSLDPDDDSAIADAIALLDQQHLAGIIALAPTQRLARALEAMSYRIPVLIDTEPAFDGTAATASLNTEGTALAVEHLLALGHRSIVHVSGPPEWMSAANRRRAYEHTMHRHGLTPSTPVAGDWTAASGYRAVRNLPLEGVTALLVGNDQMAQGALRALWERGIRVPEEMSVVGFDDVPEAAFAIPPLTTVRLDFADQGRRGVADLVARIEGRPATGAPDAGTVQLIERASTAPAPQFAD
jgi:LacI family transcriptional regulator